MKDRLQDATRSCPVPYGKGPNSFELLGRLDPTVLEEPLPSFRRARRILTDKLGIGDSEVTSISGSRFFRAAEQGDLPAIRALVAARPDLVRLDRAENDEHTALHYAVLNRDLPCARFLLEAGADPHKGIYPHRDATSPLTLAEDRGYDDLVALIRGELDRRAAQVGADPERGDELFDLVRDGDLDGVKLPHRAVRTGVGMGETRARAYTGRA